MARCKSCQAEMEGSREKERKWLRVSSAWGRRRSQRSGGKEMWVEARVEMRWFLYVLPDCAFGGVGAVVGGWDVLKSDGGKRLAEKFRKVLTRLII